MDTKAMNGRDNVKRMHKFHDELQVFVSLLKIRVH